jgi:hypothetical protein
VLDSSEIPTLDASKTNNDALLWASPCLKVSLKNHPRSCNWFPEESLTVPIVLCFHSHWSVLQLFTLPGFHCFVGGCFVVVWFVGGCFVVVSSASSLVEVLLSRVTWTFHCYRCLATVDIFASPMMDAWPLVGSLADALLPFGLSADALLSSFLGVLVCSRPLQWSIPFL